MPEQPPETIIGIDLGTTFSMASRVSERGVELIENERVSTLVPSAVAVCEGEIYAGNEALPLRFSAPENFFFSFKRFMGRGTDDVGAENFPFEISQGEQNNVLIGTGENGRTPEQLSAYVLKKIKDSAQEVLGEPVSKAVITVPAYFDDVQRQATRDAAKIAGLEAVRILNEPTAAALAYGLDERETGKILVYDLGGGTFDVSILEVKKKLFKVLATKGNTRLGGDDFDGLVAAEIEKSIGEKKTLGPLQRQQLKKISEQIKIKLTDRLSVSEQIEMPEIGISFSFEITREEYNRLIEPKIEETLALVKSALKEAGLTESDVNEIVIVGGSSRTPLAREKLAETFGIPLNLRVDPDKVVSYGAGIQAYQLAGGSRKYLLLDVIPLALGIETMGGVFSKLIVGNASIPAKATETFSTSKDGQTSVRINIYQGDREFVKDCRPLGKFTLGGIPPMPAGLPRLEVVFTVDQNGLLNVSAKETRSGAEAVIEIVPEHGLTHAQVEKMQEESIEFAREDFQNRNLVEFKMQAQRILDGLKKIDAQAKTLTDAKRYSEISEQKKKLKSLIEHGQDPAHLKKEIDAMGELTRDLADEIMSLAAKNSLMTGK